MEFQNVSEKSVTTPATSSNSFTLKLGYIYNSKKAVTPEGNCLKHKWCNLNMFSENSET